MKLPIELEIFFHTDETRTLSAVDVDYDLSDCETREMFFLSIDAISPYRDERFRHDFTTIHANNTEFICPRKYSEVKALLKLNY